MRRWVQLAFLAVAAVIVFAVLLREQQPPPPPPESPAQDVAALTAPEAPALSLPTLAGAQVDLRSYRGKVVAVNFWATWCGPCQAEIPDLAELWRARHQGCFELLGVAGMSSRQDTEQAARRIPYPVLFDGDGTAVDAWDVRSFPRTFLLDAQGRVRQVFRGAVPREQLAQAVDALLPRSCPGRNG